MVKITRSRLGKLGRDLPHLERSGEGRVRAPNAILGAIRAGLHPRGLPARDRVADNPLKQILSYRHQTNRVYSP